MTDIIVLLLFAFGIKHIICNFILRSFILALEHKLIHYGIPASGMIYILFHIISTILVLTLFAPLIPTFVLIAIVTALIHYLIDQSNKTHYDDIDIIMDHNTRWLTGFNQWIHGFVYLLTSALLMSFNLIR